MRKTEKVKIIIEKLTEIYPDPKCALNFSSGIELLVATRLSAQCTDKRVNEVTPALFEKYPSIEAFADADLSELEEIIRPCGFFRDKAKSIKEFSSKILSDFSGRVPDNIDDLITLPGVGRKTANLIVGELYGGEAYICDTHCIRLSNRFGLTESKDPAVVERDLRKIVKPEDSLHFCHRFVQYGRDVCTARNPKCECCVLKDVCEENRK